VRPPLLTWLKGLVLLGLGLWIFSPAFTGGWVWDDTVEILRNAPIRSSWHSIGGMWTAPAGADYLPLKETVQWLEWHLWGDAPLGYHLVSVSLHLLSALLFWRLLLRLQVPFAWTAAVFFAVHPMAVESVAWISELKNTLSLPLLLVSALAFVAFDECQERPDGAPKGAYALSLIAFLASLLAKSSGIMFPFVILIYGWFRHGRVTWRSVIEVVPFAAVSGAVGAVTIWFQEHRAISGVVGHVGGFGERLAVAGHALVFYFAKAVMPWPISPVYPGWIVGVSILADAWPWLAIVSVAALLWNCRARWGRGPILAMGWFVLNLLPILGFIRMSFARFSPVSDHFAYIALLGVAGGLAGILGSLEKAVPQRGSHLASGCLLIGVVGLFAWESHGLSENYRDDRAFWTFAGRRNQASWAPHNNLGLIDLDEGRLPEAVAQFEAVLRSGEQQAEVYNNLGTSFARLGRYDEAVSEFENALRLQPGYPVAEANLGNVLAQSRKYDQAVMHYRRSLELRPDVADVHTRLGMAYLVTAQPDKAAGEFAEAIRLDPRAAEPRYRLATLLANAGHLPEAIARFQETVEIDPARADAYAGLGLALTLSQRPQDALGPLRRAVELQPRNAEATAYLGLALFRLGRLSEAIDTYHSAIRISGEDPDIWYNLADALRSAGRIDEAQQATAQAEHLQRGR
jgi:tetratricopeptide (TPR) repeat protein